MPTRQEPAPGKALWGNVSINGEPQINDASGCASIVTYCNIDQATYMGGTGNIRLNPLFVPATIRLSQVASGQLSDSPCLDAGDNTAEHWGLYTRTTRTDGVPDAGQVDMGCHYDQ